MDDDSSVSSHCLSYYEEYLLLKKQYDDVLESNSQMVLRLEDAKLMLFKNTKELQNQNSTLMSENMNLRAQKEYLQQELEKLRSLVGTLMEEMGTQRGSMERQKDCMDILVCLLKSVAENKDNNLTNPETEENTGEENAPFLNLKALRELNKQLRASTIGSYYLPAIEEEKCGDVNDDDDMDDYPNATRPTHQSAFSGLSQEVQQNIVQVNSKSQVRTASKIGRRGSSIRVKKDFVEKRESPQARSKLGHLLPSLKIEGTCPQQAADDSAEMIKSTYEEENEQIQAPAIVRMSNDNTMASLEPSNSGLLEHVGSNHDAEALKEKIYNHRQEGTSKNKALETINSNLKDIDHHNQNIQKDGIEGNKDEQVFAQVIDAPQQTPNAFIMKNVAMSYQAGGVQDKIYLERFPKNCPTKVASESIQIETKTQDNHIVEKMEKSVCVIELVDLVGAAQSNHLHKVNINPKTQSKTIVLNQNIETLNKTSNGNVPKLVEGRGQPSKEAPTKGNQHSSKALAAQSTAHSLIKDVAKKTYLNSNDGQVNMSPRTVAVQPSCQIKALVSKISQAKQTKESLSGSIKPPAEKSFSEKKESKTRQNQGIRDNDCTQKSGETMNFEEQQPEREELSSATQCSTSTMTGKESAGCRAEYEEMMISTNNEDNNASTTQEIQRSSQSKTYICESSEEIENTEPSNTPNNKLADASYSGEKESKQKILPKIQGESQKLDECQDPPERERETSGWNQCLASAQSRARTISKDVMIETSPNCVDIKAIDVMRIQEFQLSSEIKASEFEISLAQEHNDSSNEPNKTLIETPCLVKKENNPRKTQIVQSGASTTENEIQQALLPIVRKSKYFKTNNRSSQSKFFTPVQDPSTPVAKNGSGRDISLISLKLEISPGEDDNETRMISRKHGNFGQRKSGFLSPSMEDFRVSTGRNLRESQMANSLLNEVRVSKASSQGDSCYGDFATPKKVKRVRSKHLLSKQELVSLLSESAGFQGNLGSEVMKEKRIMTRSRSKPRRDKEVIYNFSSTSENDEPNENFKFKPPGRRPRRAAK